MGNPRSDVRVRRRDDPIRWEGVVGAAPLHTLRAAAAFAAVVALILGFTDYGDGWRYDFYAPRAAARAHLVGQGGP